MNDRQMHDRLSTLAEDLAPPFDPARQAGAARARRRRQRRSRLVAVAALAAAVVGVSAAVLAGRPLPSAEDRLIEALAPDEEVGGGQGGAYCGPLLEDLASVSELLPNTQYRSSPGVSGSRTEAVVVGRFTAVEPGRGYVVPEPDGPSDLPVAFDDPAALYRTVHARVAVERVVAGDVRTDTVLVGFTVRGAESDSDSEHWPTLETVEEGLPALGRVILFLDDYFHPDDPSVHGLASYYGAAMSYHGPSYAFLGQVDEDGSLRLPLLPPGEAERLLADTPTLEALQDAAREPVEVIEVGHCGERLE